MSTSSERARRAAAAKTEKPKPSGKDADSVGIKPELSWQWIKQKTVALSSYEAEYIATASATTQALWLSRLLEELLGREVEVVELKVDSKSTLALAKNPVFHDWSKHIKTKFPFIRDCHLEDGSIKAIYIPTTDQLDDILTKSLGRSKFQEMREKIGLKKIV